MTTLSHPTLTAEQLTAIEEQMHRTQSHPLYEYTSSIHADLQPPIGKYWELNEALGDSSDHGSTLPNWKRHWRRAVIGNTLNYDQVIETIQMAAVGQEIHPWFEFKQEEVIFDHRIEASEELTIDYFLNCYVLSRLNNRVLGGPLSDKPTDWVMNRLHVTGGFNLSAYAARFFLYRRLPEHT